MAASVKIDFQPFGAPAGGDLVVFVGDDLKPADAALEIEPEIKDVIAGAAGPERFKGKPGTALTIPAPAGLSAERLIAVGIGGESDRGKLVYADLGAAVAGKLAGRSGTVVAALPGLAPAAEDIAQMALGARLRLYRVRPLQDEEERGRRERRDDAGSLSRSRTRRLRGRPRKPRTASPRASASPATSSTSRRTCSGPRSSRTAPRRSRSSASRSRFSTRRRCRKLGMRALLAVGQGSARESRVVLMRWNGGKASDKPVAFVGKGVVFDSGGISIKPGGGMEDMKGDMAGAACVVGLMHALAARKARANVIGAIGLVENMPDGAAQRPGDIVTTMSGQTVEIINTDAEGRLVLADVLWHVRERYKPAFMLDLATLTGAILVALAQEYAGMFSNSDELAERLAAAGQATGEKVWRMPLGPAYDKMIDSKFADMKNAAGRHGGSITAAQFLQRFVGDTPWVHLDIAGTAMNALQTETNKSWGSGWGVRLLDRLVRDHYER